MDVRDVTLDSLRGAIGIVSQDTFLFSTTVAENIAYGTPEATPEEIVDAAAQAQAHEFIMRPARRLRDARRRARPDALGRPAPADRDRPRAARWTRAILILDDATASVDATTEARIKLALREVMKGRTTLIIAHRLSTISLAERVVVLDGRPDRRPGHARRADRESAVYRQIHSHGLVDRTFVSRPGRRADREGGRMSGARSFGSHVGRMGHAGSGLGWRATVRRVRSLAGFARPYAGRAILAMFALLARHGRDERPARWWPSR